MAVSHSAAGAHRPRLAVVLGLSSVVLVAELVAGLASNSLALFADAGHVFADVVGTGLALSAIWLAARPTSANRTYGLYRVEILAAVINALLLFGIAVVVLLEAWRRLAEPPEIASGPMVAVAAGALIANGAGAWLLHPGQRESLNIRGAYLEVLGDAFGAAAVLVAGIVITLTGFRAADAIASTLIGLLILPRTWHLLREALDVLLEAGPHRVDLAEVRRHILETPGVTEVHDLHSWMITSGMPILTAHVVVRDETAPADVLRALTDCVRGCFDIEHSTIQFETPAQRQLERRGHP